MGYFFYLLVLLPLRSIFLGVLGFIGNYIPFIRSIEKRLDQISTIFHEWCHFLMLKIVLIPVSLSDISYSHNYHSGSVVIHSEPKNVPRFSLIKMILVSLAQLLVGTWAILKISTYWTHTTVWGKIGIVLVDTMLILGFQPSPADYRIIYTCGIQLRPWVALRQFIFLIISLLTYLVFADKLNRFHSLIPILFEMVMILSIFFVYDMACILIYDGLYYILRLFFGKSEVMPIKKSKKSKISMFADPLENEIMMEDSI